MKAMVRTAELLEAGSADLLWFSSQRDALRKRYEDQFIAICDKQVLASAKTLDELMADLKRRKADLSRVLVQHMSTMQQIL